VARGSIFDPKYSQQGHGQYRHPGTEPMSEQAKQSLLEMPSATARGLLKIPGYVADIPALGMHYLSTGLSGMLPEEANQALGIRSFQNSMLEPAGGSAWIGKQLDKAPSLFPRPETTVGQVTEFLAEISPLAVEALPGAVARRFGAEAVPYLAKKISDIQANLVRPDDLSPIEALLLSDPRLSSSIVSGYSTGPSSVFGKRKQGEVIDEDTQKFFAENRSPLREEKGTGQVEMNLPIQVELPHQGQNPVFTSLLQNHKSELLQNAPNKPQLAEDWLKVDEKGELKEGLLGRLAKSAKNVDGEMITSPSELKDIGLLDYLKAREGQLVTKQEIENYIDDFYDGLEITEVAHGDKPTFKVFDADGNKITATTHSNFDDWFEDHRDEVEEAVERALIYDNHDPKYLTTTRNLNDLLENNSIDQSDIDYEFEYNGNVDFDEPEEVEDFMSDLMSIDNLDADDVFQRAKDGEHIEFSGTDVDPSDLLRLGFNEYDQTNNWYDEASNVLSEEGVHPDEHYRILLEDEEYYVLENTDNGVIEDASIEREDLSETEYELNMEEWHEMDDAEREQFVEDLGYDSDEWKTDVAPEALAGQTAEITNEGDPLFQLGYKNLPEGGGITRQSKWKSQTVGDSGINYRELVFSLGEKSVTPEFRRHALNLARKYNVPMNNERILATFKPLDLDADLNPPPEILMNWTPEEADEWTRLREFTKDKISKMKGQNLAHAFSGEPLTNFQPVWMRFSDRLDQNGNRVLYLEEVQSDWFQAMHSKGERKSLEGLEFVEGEISDYKDAIVDYDEFIDLYRKYNFPDGPPRLRYETKDTTGETQEAFASLEQIGPTPNDVNIVDVYETPLADTGTGLRIQSDFDSLYQRELDADQTGKISRIKSNTGESRGLRRAYDDLRDLIVEARDVTKNPNAQRDLERLGELFGDIEAKARRTSNITRTRESAPYGHPLGNRDRWIRMALKRALRWGADNGYERVAFASAKDIMSVNHVQPVQKIDYMINADGQFKDNLGMDSIQITATDQHGSTVTHEYDPYSGYRYNTSDGSLTRDYLEDMIDPNTAKMLKKEFKRLKEESSKYTKESYEAKLYKQASELGGGIGDLPEGFSTSGTIETSASKAVTYGSGRAGDIYKHIYDRVLPQYVKKLSKKLKLDAGITRVNKNSLIKDPENNTFEVNELLKKPKSERKSRKMDFSDAVPATHGNTEATYIDITDGKTRNYIRKGMNLLD